MFGSHAFNRKVEYTLYLACLGSHALRTKHIHLNIIPPDLERFSEIRGIQSALSNFSNGWGHLNTYAKNVRAIGLSCFFVEYCGQAQYGEQIPSYGP